MTTPQGTEIPIPEDLRDRYQLLLDWRNGNNGPWNDMPSHCTLGTERELIERIAALSEENRALKASIKESCGHDGACDHCGAVPALQVPFQLCDGCRNLLADNNARLRADLDAALGNVAAANARLEAFIQFLKARACKRCAEGVPVLVNSSGFYSHREDGNYCSNHHLMKAVEDWEDSIASKTPLPLPPSAKEGQ